MPSASAAEVTEIHLTSAAVKTSQKPDGRTTVWEKQYLPEEQRQEGKVLDLALKNTSWHVAWQKTFPSPAVTKSPRTFSSSYHHTWGNLPLFLHRPGSGDCSKAGVMQTEIQPRAATADCWGKALGEEPLRSGFRIKWMALVSIRSSVSRRKRNPVALITWEGSICTSRPDIASTDRWFRGAKQREKTMRVNSDENSYLSDCCRKPERKKCHQGQRNLPWHCWKQLQILPGNQKSYSSTIYRTMILVHFFLLQNSYRMSQKGSTASGQHCRCCYHLLGI